MDKVKDFIETVVNNLEVNGIDLEINNVISLFNLRKGIRVYFGYTTDESVTKTIKLLVERGFIKDLTCGFKIKYRIKKK